MSGLPPTFPRGWMAREDSHTTKFIVGAVALALTVGNQSDAAQCSDPSCIGGASPAFRIPAAETRLHGWPYRIRTSMCGQNIHLFEPRAMFSIRGLDGDRGHPSGELFSPWRGIISRVTPFCSRSEAENPHIVLVLAIIDEFRERIAFWGIQEKFRKRSA
jgi:hypothetical protein